MSERATYRRHVAESEASTRQTATGSATSSSSMPVNGRVNGRAATASESPESHMGDLEDELEAARARARGGHTASSSGDAARHEPANEDANAATSEQREADALLSDRRDAEGELLRWENAGPLKLSQEDRKSFNLVNYWQVCTLIVSDCTFLAHVVLGCRVTVSAPVRSRA